MIKSNISLSDARLEGAVVQSIKDWATAFPEDLVAFDKQMKQLRSRLAHQNAMSRDERVMHCYEIPMKLNGVMQFRFGRDWRDDPAIRRHFFDHFKVGQVGKPNRGKVWVRMEK